MIVQFLGLQVFLKNALENAEVLVGEGPPLVFLELGLDDLFGLFAAYFVEGGDIAMQLGVCEVEVLTAQVRVGEQHVLPLEFEEKQLVFVEKDLLHDALTLDHLD